MIQRKLADMATRIYVADSMSYRTAGLMDDAAAAIDHDAPDASRRLVEEAVEVALGQSCRVITCVDNADLDVHGRVGAVLRF